MNKRHEHAGVTNRFANEYTTKTGGLNGAFGFPRNSGGGVIVQPEGEYIRINGHTRFIPAGVLCPILSMDFIHTRGMTFHCFDKDKKHIQDAEHRGFGEFFNSDNEQLSDVEYVIPYA